MSFQQSLALLGHGFSHSRQQRRGQKKPEEEWDEHDYEKFMKERDARTDKHMELLDKCGDSEEAEEKIAKEMGWLRERTEEEAEHERQRIEEMNAACEEVLNEPEPESDPHREGIDWILPETTIAEARKELFEIREGILRLMDEFRGRA